jgi:hypothetical protein
LLFTPKREGQREFYEFKGEDTIRPIIEGIVPDAVSTFGVPNARQLEPDRRMAQADRRVASGGLTTCRSVFEAVQ